MWTGPALHRSKVRLWWRQTCREARLELRPIVYIMIYFLALNLVLECLDWYFGQRSIPLLGTLEISLIIGLGICTAMLVTRFVGIGIRVFDRIKFSENRATPSKEDGPPMGS